MLAKASRSLPDDREWWQSSPRTDPSERGGNQEGGRGDVACLVNR